MFIPAITLHEPWATLMMLDSAEERKRIETRNWKPVVNGHVYTGPLVIHAGRTLDEDTCREEPFVSVLKRFFGTWNFLDRFSLGCILGSVELLHVERTEVLRPVISTIELAFGNYDPERFGWCTDYHRRLPKPIPARGRQKLWPITPEQHREIMRQTPDCALPDLSN